MIIHTDKSHMTFAEYVASNVGDKFFTVTFVKANGEERVLTGRLGVTKHTVSGKTKDIHNNYLCVYDVNKKGYRNVNLNTIRKIECGDFKISLPFANSCKTKDIHNNYLCVYDVNKKGYRNVNLNTIRKIECGDFKISCPFGYRERPMTHEEFSVLSDMEAI